MSETLIPVEPVTHRLAVSGTGKTTRAAQPVAAQPSEEETEEGQQSPE